MKSNAKLTIRQLPKTKKAQIDAQNPIQKIQLSKYTSEQEKYLQEIGSIYGNIKEKQLSQPERLPCLRSSFLSLECHLGRLNKLQFEDVFCRDNNIMKVNPHQLYLSQFN